MTHQCIAGYILALTLGLFGTAAISRGDYNAASDFSATSNSNGAWSYGWSQTLGSAFTIDTLHQNSSGVDFWEGNVSTGNPPGDFPIIGHNGTTQNIVYAQSVHVAPGQLYQHPGPDGEYSDVRFTVPATGLYSVTASFTGIDVTPTTTDVHILFDGTSLFSGAVNTYDGGPAFSSGTLELNAGDTLDFAVGYGSNGNYFSDSTGLAADISVVPEPSNFAIFGVGIVGIIVFARGDRQRVA